MSLSKPSPRYASFATVANSKFFLWGGREKVDEENRPSSLLYYFDFCNEIWHSAYLKGLLPPGLKFGSCTRNRHYLYVYGGEDQNEYYTRSLFAIDTEKFESIELSSFDSNTGGTAKPMAKNDSGMTFYEGKVILFGGKPSPGMQDSDERTNELHVYNLQTGLWSAPKVTGDIPHPCSSFSYTQINEDTLVVFGGYFGNDIYSNDLYTLNLKKLHWTKFVHKKVWPAPRRAHTASVLGYGTNNVEIVIIGGVNVESTLDEVWKLSTNTWEWKKLPISGHEILRRRWHMSGSRQISPELCEVILFGGIRGRKIMNETALITFAYDQWDRTWIAKEIVDKRMLGSMERLQKKALLNQTNEEKAYIKEETKAVKKTRTLCSYFWIFILAPLLMVLFSLIIYILIY